MLDLLITVPHGAPGNDIGAPPVAKALDHILRQRGVSVRTLISKTCRYTMLDMNRDSARGTQFRAAVRKAIELDKPKIHIDVHSFPDQISRFGHQDIVLLHGFEHPDRDKPLQDGEWLRRYAKLLCATPNVTACVQPSEYPNDVCQHVVMAGQPRDRTMLAEHYDDGDPQLYAMAHADAIGWVLSGKGNAQATIKLDKDNYGDADEIDLDRAQQAGPGVAGDTGGGGLATPARAEEGKRKPRYPGDAVDAPSYDVLKKNKVDLDPEERAEVMKRDAVWHFSHLKKPSPAVWKAEVGDRVYFVTNTHRAYNVCTTLKGAIKRYHDFIKGTSESVA